MNRRSFLLLGGFFLVAPVDFVAAQGLPVSTLTVKVLSVELVSLRRHTFRRESFQTGESSGGWSEDVGFVARARIEAVMTDNHGLMPGAAIDIHYGAVRSSVPAEVRDRALKAGETVTLAVFRHPSGLFYWRQQP